MTADAYRQLNWQPIDTVYADEDERLWAHIEVLWQKNGFEETYTFTAKDMPDNSPYPDVVALSNLFDRVCTKKC